MWVWIRDPRSGIRDPGSGKNLFRIPDPGVKMAPDLDPKHWSAQLTVESTALCRLWIVFLHQHDRPDFFVILYSFVSEETGIEPKRLPVLQCLHWQSRLDLIHFGRLLTLCKSVLLIWITDDKKLIFCSFLNINGLSLTEEMTVMGNQMFPILPSLNPFLCFKKII